MVKNSYRPDIDGLRAIAVIGVLIFHAFPGLIPGGFSGVDIFFVISGYLITSIIKREIELNNFSIIEFYSRRARRIFPALSLVLIFCLVIGWQVLLANEYAELGWHTAFGAGFFANFAFWMEAGYFDKNAQLKPLQHLWSLGVEEQFYIFWPILLWALINYSKRVVWSISIILFLSCAAAIWMVFKDQSSAFYLPYFRAWELLAGALLIYLMPTGFDGKNPISNYLNQNHRSIFGLFLLLIGFFALSDKDSFPGLWALPPVVGTALLISAPNAAFNKLILGSQALRYIGLISFPLYLWHWPLLSYARIIKSTEPDTGLKILLLGISIIFSVLTFHGWERVLRKRGRKTALVLSAAMLIIGATGFNIHKREGLDFRYWTILKQPKEIERDFSKWADKGMYPEGDCASPFLYPNTKICLQTNENSAPDTIVFGDSHAFHAYWGIARSFASTGHNIKLLGRGGCTFMIYHNDGDCDKTYEMQLDWMSNQNAVRNVILAFRNTLANDAPEADRTEYRNRFADTIQRLEAHGKHVIVVYSVPEDRINPELCVASLPFGRKANLTACSFTAQRELEQQTTYRSLVAAVVAKHPDVQTFDPLPVLCPAGSCAVVRDGHAFWTDSNHISESASYIQGAALSRSVHLY